MTTLGQKLQEARKRQGLSLKDASEQLKIKIDFLSHFENDRFDFNLPEVYMYGFLKLYVSHLKLDPKVLMTEYSSIKQLNIHDNRKKESREVFGKMHLQKKPQFLSDPNNNFKVLEEEAALLSEEEEAAEAATKKNALNKSYTQYFILAAILVFIGICSILGILAWNWLKPAENTPILATAQEEQVNPTQEDTLIIIAENQVHVVVRQESNKQRLFSGTISPNQPQSIIRQGPVKIHFSDGTSLLIKKSNGQKIKPGRSGVGWIEV